MKTYGKVEYDEAKRGWKIQCEPHVSLKLKRVFGKLNKGSTGTHFVSDTAENAADITWFLQRYPMEVQARDRLEERTSRYREQVSLVDSIVSGNYVPPEFDLAMPPREYQKIAASMLLARGGLLLADEVGLGKTVSSICTFSDRRTLPAVVVTLTHLPRQWKTEIERFAPNLNIHIVKHGTPYDMAAKRGRSSQPTLFSSFPDVVIINYHKLAGWAETLGKVCASVVFDECQELRKTGSAKYTAAFHLINQVRFRMGLSATPIFNYGGEIYNVLNCLFPNELGTASEFGTEWCGGWTGDKSKITNTKAFASYVRDSGMMLRRTREDVGRELPEVQTVAQYIDSDTAALDRVSGACAELAKLILADTQNSPGEKMRASEELSNTLRQATGIAKAPYVAEFVRLILESGEKVALFGWHREFYSIIMDRLKEFKPALYTGSESTPQKEESKRRFVAGETDLLIISLRSGAGLDGLQSVCKIAVFGELDWSPAVHHQNVGRIHRDGQKDSVIAYYLIAEDGSDPIVAQVLGVKKQQSEGVMRALNDESVIEKLQTDGGHIRKLAEAYLENKGQAA